MKPDLLDVLAVVGLVLVAAGAAGQWGWPVAAMIAGGLLITFVVASAVRTAETIGDDEDGKE